MRARVAVAVLVGMLVVPAAARAERAFSPRFSANTQGAIAFAANGVLTCVQAEGGCPQARDGTGTRLNNNDRVMTYVDVDTDDSTFNSSEATLSLPAGARVLFAGLYFGGRSAAGTGGLPPPNPAARGTVLVRAPGDGGYRSVTATVVDDAGQQEYQAFADVTPIVGAAGAGAYRVANVQVGTGRNASQSHGWALIVVYGDPAAPTRNLTVFDGLQNVGSGSPGVTIPLSGFQTPLSGTVTSSVGIVAQEGDLGTTGDLATIQGAGGAQVPLTNAANPGTPANVFNSSISRAGVRVTDKQPPDANTFGFDVDTFATTDVLGNDQTSTEVRLTTTGDAYIPGVVFIATDLYAPRITATKEVDQTEADLGDELIYTARFENSGEDGAAEFVVTDPIPSGTTYVPGSLAIDGVPQTDAGGDDQAEFDASGNRIVARLGDGANATAGGTLAIGDVSEVTFRVRVDAGGFELGAEVSNAARASFSAETTGQDYAPVESAPAVTRLRVPDVAIVKFHDPAYVAGSTSTILIAAFNIGEGPTNGEVVVSDTLPAGLSVNGPILADGWSCTVSGQTITCTRADVFDPFEEIPAILVPVAIALGTPTGSLANTASVTNASDGNTGNNEVTDEGAVSEPQFDLSVEKVVTSSPPGGLPGYGPGPVTYEITVRNDGTQPAPEVQLTDVVPAAFDVTSATPSQGSCSGADCSLGTIAPGGEVTVALQLELSGAADRYPSAESLVNRATVTGAGFDVDESNNTAEASIQTLPITELSITKDLAPTPPAAGGPITFTMQIRNDGPGVADVSTGDLLPPEILDPELSISGGTGECFIGLVPGDDPTNPQFPEVPQCTIPQLEVGGTRTFTIRGRLAPDSAGTAMTNTAVVTGTSVESDFSDNVARVPFVVGEADVGIVKTRVSGGTVPVGGEAVFELVARNTPPDDPDVPAAPATGVEVSDTLPAGLTPVAADPGCTITGQTVVCRIDELAPDEERAFEVRARAEPAAAGQTLTNRGTVTALAYDADTEDNESEAAVTVGPLPGAAPPRPPVIGPPPGAAPPPIQVDTECRSRRRFVIRIIERPGRQVRSAVVRVAGRRVAVMRRRSDRRLVAVVNLRGKPRSVYRVVIRARLRDGRRVRWVRSYRTCIDPLPPSNRLDHPRAL